MASCGRLENVLILGSNSVAFSSLKLELKIDQKFIKFSSCFLICFWCHFGSILKAKNDPKWAQNVPKCVSKRFRREKDDFHETIVKTNEIWWFLPPRGNWKWPKINPERLQDTFFFHVDFRHRFWKGSGLVLEGFSRRFLREKLTKIAKVRF